MKLQKILCGKNLKVQANISLCYNPAVRRLKSVAKLREQYTHDIYFNTKKRNRIKKAYLNLKNSILAVLDTTTKPLIKQDFQDRDMQVSFLNISIKGLKGIEEAEEFHRKTTLKRCRFKLYKSLMGKQIIIQNDFYKPSEERQIRKFIIFSHGLPRQLSKKKVRVSEEKIDLQGYEIIDSGSFKQKIESFTSYKLTYKGKVFKIKLRLTSIKDVIEYSWASI